MYEASSLGKSVGTQGARQDTLDLGVLIRIKSNLGDD